MSSDATSIVDKETGHRTYSESVGHGFYEKNTGGLFGKHDNVRTYWEDQLTGQVLRPHVKPCVDACVASEDYVRILDLGCGAGEGYELLTRIPEKDLSLEVELRRVLPRDRIGAYVGLDLSEAMVSQGRRNYRGIDHVTFHQGDLCDGLGPMSDAEPFDIYFSSYGSLSHLDAETLRGLLADLACHAEPGAMIVLDLVGRYSPEWPTYWGHDGDAMLPYSMSYLYSERKRKAGDIDQFLLRYWTRPEVLDLCRSVSQETGVSLHVEKLFDRSIFVGRHVDTGEYASLVPRLRSAVNSLFELNVRTDLERLRIDYRPVAGAKELNDFFESLAQCWNQLVDFATLRMRGERVDLPPMDGWYDFPPALQMALMSMDRVVDGVGWVKFGDVRANIIEPQLAYLLRSLEIALQAGMGCGHGLLAMLRVGEGN